MVKRAIPDKLPTYDQFMNPLLAALRELGGSGSVEEINAKVAELERLPEDVLSQPHDQEKSNQTEVAYRLAWARTYLKKYGLVENSKGGVWSLTAKAIDVVRVNPQDVARAVRAQYRKVINAQGGEAVAVAPAEVSEEETWKQKLHEILRTRHVIT